MTIPEAPTTVKGHLESDPRPAPPLDFGSQIAMFGGLPKDVKARIDAIERGDPR